MKLFTELFSTDVGLLSAGVIAFTLVMGLWYVHYFVRKMNEDARPPR